MNIHFYKYQGAGNDFIMIDNRKKFFDADNEKLIESLCHRRFGIGSDGLILLEEADGYDFRMVYFNLDGKEASMCGNGGRCIVAFANKLGIVKSSAKFIASDGPHEALITSEGLVDLHMIDVEKVDKLIDGYFLNTGVPHLVHFVDDLEIVDVNLEGRQLRWDARFQPAGTNVDFVKQDGDHLTVYTYERGVEAGTLACGTGITASALSAAVRLNRESGEFKVTAKGGELAVKFQLKDRIFTDVWLKGPATLVYDGDVEI
ncbi:MAG TPA: diaminopimelate epimerase [Prolixibacteraceae bacterium]|nr:diaminopimelate epimerase [Prolixibacteraceae bacterium]